MCKGIKKWLFCGVLLLLCLAFVSCGQAKDAVSESVIAEVVVTGEALDTLRLTVELTNQTIASCHDSKAYVYVLPSHLDATADLSQLSAVAEFVPQSRQTIEIPLVQGSVSRLYASFIVGTYDPQAETYVPLTSAVTVANPQVLQTTTPIVTINSSPSIKGLVAQSNSDAFSLGLSHVILPVDMEDILRANYQTGNVAYTWNGVTYYLDASELSTLDNAISAYTSAGVQVYLQFKLGGDVVLSSITGTSIQTSVPAYLYLPGVSASMAGYAVNMQDEASALHMEGFFDFISQRYAYAGSYISFIVGDKVNAMTSHANSGNLSAEWQVANYEKWVRLVHTAMKAHNPQGDVYISLDHQLSGNACAEGDLGLRAYLDKFLAEVARRGDYDFHIACDLYTPVADVWEEDTSVEPDFLTVHSLSTLTDLLQANKYLTQDDSPRQVILTGFAIPTDEGAVGDTTQAYGYAYAYGCVVSNPWVRAMFYDSHYDDERMSGLRYRATAEERGRTKEIYDVFALIDTDKAEDIQQAAADYIGEAYEDVLSGLSQRIPPVQQVESQGDWISADKPMYITPIARFDQGDDYDMTLLDGTAYIKFAYAESLSKPCLQIYRKASVASGIAGVMMEVSAADLMHSKYLYMDICHHLTTNEGERADPLDLQLVMVRQTTQEGTAKLVYEGRVEQTEDKRWQRAKFDIEDFSRELQADDKVTLMLLYAYEDQVDNILSWEDVYTGSLHLGLSSSISGIPVGDYTVVTVKSPLTVSISQICVDTPPPEDNSATVIVVIASVVLVVALGGVAYVLALGRKRRRY